MRINDVNLSIANGRLARTLVNNIEMKYPTTVGTECPSCIRTFLGSSMIVDKLSQT